MLLSATGPGQWVQRNRVAGIEQRLTPAFVMRQNLQAAGRGFSLAPPHFTSLVIRELGICDYHLVWRAMRDHSRTRACDEPDQLWLTEHPPVYTLGRNGDVTHIADAGGIPVIRTDRGGQAAYHGPGQVVLYTLVDLRARGLSVRRFVKLLETTTIELLDCYGIAAARRAGAPGVYVGGRKIAALGLRVSRGCCYHGVALNVNMDLRPFRRIVVCGMAGMAVTQMHDLGVEAKAAEVGSELARRLARCLA